MNEQTIQTAAVVAGIFLGLFILERLMPLRRRSRGHWGRVFLNLAISALAFLAAFVLVKPAAMALMQWSAEKPFGLLHLAAMPVAAQFVVAFLLMDLSFYYWHVANHRIPLLWRFHNVHHIDPDLDVSTAFRFHFGEVAFSAGFRAVQVSVIGLPLWMFLVYEMVFQANTLFHHSNVRLPIGLERWLNKVIVTPRMHGIHHSQVQGETNSNYSVVFSWWDRIHRTLGLNIPQSQIVVGIAGYARPGDNRLWTALAMPFRKQRDYWKREDGTAAQRDAEKLPGRRDTLAE